MKPVHLSVALLPFALSFLSEPVRGAVLALEFAGVVNTIDDPQDALAGRVRVGDAFTGRFTFDSSALDGYPADPTKAVYTGPAFRLLALAGTLPIVGLAGGPISYMEVGDGFSGLGDFYRCVSGDFDSADLHFGDAGMLLADSAALALSGDALPVLGQDLSLFSNVGFGAKGSKTGVGNFMFSGMITSAAVVPEPNALALFVLCGLLSRRRLRDR